MRPVVVGIFLIALTLTNVRAQETAIPPRLRTFARDGRVRLTRVMGTPEVHMFASPSAFSADGKHVIFVEDLSTNDEKARRYHARISIWEVGRNTWPREIEIPGKSIVGLDLSLDAKTALLSGQVLEGKETEPRSFVSLWDLAAGKEIKSIVTKDPEIAYRVALSPDGAFALVASRSRLTEWNLRTGEFKELVKFDKEQPGVDSLAFLPGGKQFLATSGRGIEIWDNGKTKPVRSFVDKKKGRESGRFAISKDGKRLVTVNEMSLLMLWDLQAGTPLQENRLDEKSPHAISDVIFADDGKTILATVRPLGGLSIPDPRTRLIAWDTEAKKIRWSNPPSYYGFVPMHVQGDKLLVGGGPDYLDVLSITDGKLMERHGGHKASIQALGISKNDNVISVDADGALITWRNGNLLKREMPHPGPVTALAFNENRTQWLTAGADLQIKSWPPDAMRAATFKKKHTGPITSLAFSADGRWAASGSADRSVRTWFVPTGEEIDVLNGHSEGVNAVAISPDDRWLASASDDTTIKVWPIKDGKLDPDREAITLEKHTKPVTCLTFTPDGKRLLSGSQDQKLLVWNWQKGSMDFMIPGHKNWINSILLLDADTVLTSSDDLSICAWDLRTGMEIGRVDFGSVGDCPRCLAKVGPDRFIVGSSSWLVYEFQLVPAGKSKSGGESSNK